MTDGIPQVCNVGNCTASEKWDLTEIPMWSTYSPGSMAAISSMDPSGNDFDTYKQQVCGEGVGGCACVCGGGQLSSERNSGTGLPACIHWWTSLCPPCAPAHAAGVAAERQPCPSGHVFPCG